MTDGFEQWVVGLPVWFQTPLVLAVLALFSALVAAVAMWLLNRILPYDDAERRVFGMSERGAAGNSDDRVDRNDRVDHNNREGGDPQ